MQIHLVVAKSEQQIADAERLRWKVYVEEERMLSAYTDQDSRERDRYDASPSTTQLLIYAGAEAVGTVRLTTADPPSGASSRCAGLQIDTKFLLSGFDQPGMKLAEVTRYCVLRRFRGTRVTPTLFAALRQESERRGVTHWVAAANMETDSPEDAAVAYQIIRAKQLLSQVFHARPRALEPAPPHPTRLVYTDEERKRARRGELEAMKLPRILALFASKMGARYIGSPSYDPRFRVFATPLAVELAAIGGLHPTVGGIARPRLELAP